MRSQISWKKQNVFVFVIGKSSIFQLFVVQMRVWHGLDDRRVEYLDNENILFFSFSFEIVFWSFLNTTFSYNFIWNHTLTSLKSHFRLFWTSFFLNHILSWNDATFADTKHRYVYSRRFFLVYTCWAKLHLDVKHISDTCQTTREHMQQIMTLIADPSFIRFKDNGAGTNTMQCIISKTQWSFSRTWWKRRDFEQLSKSL